MSGLEWLCILGALLLGLGTLAPIIRGTLAAALSLQFAGLVIIGICGAAVLFGAPMVGDSFQNGLDPSLGIDGLSGFFLATLALVAAPSLVFSRGYLVGTEHARALVALSGMFLLSLIGVVVARDPTSFLAFWELMTLIPATAILVRRSDAVVRHAVFVYLAVTHLGGVGVWICVLALANYGALSDPSALVSQGAGVQAAIIVAAIIGFGTKAGLMPMHAWLPRAHPVAPSHISALMSGVMVKVALYGLIRVLFEWAAPAPLWTGFVVLGLGLLSALGGVLYALTQHDLKRMLAFHTIENVGIVALGLGASILFASGGNTTWAAIAFAAALLHILNHAVFKSLLFLAAGTFERVIGSLELDSIGGLLRRMPWTGGAFLIGAIAIAGVPPLNGFASEWLVFQSLIHVALGPSVGVGLAGGIATAAFAATAALAVYCFVKVIGLVLLGEPRRSRVETAHEMSTSMIFGPVFLAGCCVALGAAPGLLVPTLMGLAPVPGSLPLEPGLKIPGTGTLPSLWLMLGLSLLTVVLWRLRGARRAAPTPVWVCGQELEPSLAWSSVSFTKPLRLVLEAVLRPRREVSTVRDQGRIQSVHYHSDTPHLFDTLLYGPMHRGAVTGARFVRRLQSGSIRAYAAYLLVLLLGLLILTRLGVFG